jgi:hypothetical protein
MISDQEIKDAIDRIAHSQDGKLLYLFLQKRLMAITTDFITLPTDHGQRILAATLMGLMAKGITESGGSSDSIYTFAVAGPRAVSAGPRGAGRRVTADTFIPGYSDPDSPGGGTTDANSGT